MAIGWIIVIVYEIFYWIFPYMHQTLERIILGLVFAIWILMLPLSGLQFDEIVHISKMK